MRIDVESLRINFNAHAHKWVVFVKGNNGSYINVKEYNSRREAIAYLDGVVSFLEVEDE